MIYDIHVPQLGESVSEASVGQWLKKKGDIVQQDDPLVSLETDKVALEVKAPASGVLSEILVQEGATVGAGGLLGRIEEAGQVSEGRDAKSAVSKKEDQASVVAQGVYPMDTLPPAPSARKLASEKGIDLVQVSGSGKRGQILKGDILEVAAQQDSFSPLASSHSLNSLAGSVLAPGKGSDREESPPSSLPSTLFAREGLEDSYGYGGEERVRMTRLRQTVARRLKEAQNTAAMLTTFNEVDMSAIIELRGRYRDNFEKKYGVKLGFMSFFVKAAVDALKEIRALNAEMDGVDLIYKKYYHIGIAVGAEKGLVVPVIRDCDRLNAAEIEKQISDYGRRARANQLTIEEMQGGSFTITNGGIYGSLMSTPILNVPQAGILGMHKIQERPVAVNGKIEIRPMMYLALTYDHRIVDGKEAVTFLVRIKEQVEEPARTLLGL